MKITVFCTVRAQFAALSVLFLTATSVPIQAFEQSPVKTAPVQIMAKTKHFFGDRIGGPERIGAADVIHTLTQKIPAAACHLHNGIAADESRRLIVEAKAKFDEKMGALKNGDPALKIIGKEAKRSILKDLDDLNSQWHPMLTNVYRLMGNPNNTDAFAYIKSEHSILNELAFHLTSEIQAKYSNPAELLQLDAVMLNVVGRQKMLTQKISKEACEIWSGNQSEDHVKRLQYSVDMFELGLIALHDGLPELGIIPAPTPEIKASLQDVIAQWAGVKALLSQVMNNSIDDHDKANLYNRLNNKMYKLENIAHLYTAYAKHE